MKAKISSKGNVKLVLTKEEAIFLHEFVGHTSNTMVQKIIERKLTEGEKREDVIYQVYKSLDDIITTY